MTLIESNRRATDQEWDTMVDAAPTAIYFQTREWFEIWAEYAGFKIDTRLVTFRSAKKVLLPLCHQDFLGGLLRVHFLAPKGMGGFVTNDILDPAERTEMHAVLQDLKLLYARFNPYDIPSNESDVSNASDTTQVLDLSGGFEKAFGGWTEGHRKRAMKGLREAITFGPATSEDDWEEYFALYQESLARWGSAATNRYDWTLFQAMFRNRSSGIQLWLAKHEGKAVCGAINLYHNRHVAGWHSASSVEITKKLNATLALEYCMIKNACQRSFLLYDLLGSGGDDHIADFKSGFGAQLRPVPVYKSRGMRVLTAIRQLLRRYPATRFLVRGTGS